MVSKMKSTIRDEQGMASIIVTVIIMLIISLIVIGFASLARREQRQALDDQLSTQAFYAAESAVNDVKTHLPATVLPTYATTCQGPGSYINYLNTQGVSNDLNSSSGTKYTCVLVDSHPKDLTYDRVSTNNSTIAPLYPDGSLNTDNLIDTVTISWQDADGGSNVTGCRTTTDFPAIGSWPATCQTGVLRVDVPNDAFTGASLHRDRIRDATYTFFLYPQNNGTGQKDFDLGTIYPYSNDKDAIIVPVNCDNSGAHRCTVSISGFSSTDSTALRLKSIYKDSAVSVSAWYEGTALFLTGGQVKVDATGKANDVLRRIQVRLPAAPSYSIPEFAVQTGSAVCKKLLVARSDGSTSTSDGSIASCDIFSL